MRSSIKWYPQQEFDLAKQAFVKSGRFNLAVEVHAPCGCKVRGLYQAPNFTGRINAFPGECRLTTPEHEGLSSKLAAECSKLALATVNKFKRNIKPAEDIPYVGTGDISGVGWGEYT